MLDTFVLKYRLSEQQREVIYKAMNSLIRIKGLNQYLHLNKRQSSRRFNLYTTAAFYPNGILEVAIKDCWYPCNIGSAITLKCKPALILHKGDDYALSTSNDYNAATGLVNDFIMDLNFYMETCQLPLLEGWDVDRIDYAFQFPSQEFALYLMLLRKGCSYREDNYSSSIHIKNSKSTINFYDKTEQLGFDDKCHILRFEVQCRADYLYKMLYDERIGSLKLRELWDEHLALSIVTKRIGKLVGYSDFYSIDAAEAVLQETSRINDNEKYALRLLLKLSLYPSIRRESQWDLFAVHLRNVDAWGKIRGRMERLLKRLCMNQLAIPARRKVKKLKNPVRVIRESL